MSLWTGLHGDEGYTAVERQQRAETRRQRQRHHLEEGSGGLGLSEAVSSSRRIPAEGLSRGRDAAAGSRQTENTTAERVVERDSSRTRGGPVVKTRA
jgi:hypothetical protein